MFLNYSILAASQIGLFILASKDTALEPAFEITNLFLYCVVAGAICNIAMWLSSDGAGKSDSDKRSFFARFIVIMLTGGVVGGMSFLAISLTGASTPYLYLLSACASGMTSTKSMQFISKKYSIHENKNETE